MNEEAENKVVDLMAALEESVRKAKAERDRRRKERGAAAYRKPEDD